MNNLGWFLGVSLVVLSQTVSLTAAATPEKAKLLFNIQGKGSSLAYDAGAFKEAYRSISALRNEEVVLSANSGGSIVAAYLTCHGITKESVDDLKTVLVQGTPRIKASVKELRETAENYGLKLQMLVKGKVPYIPITNLDAYVESALGLKDISELKGSKACQFKVPFVIVAANYEAVHNIHPTFAFAEIGKTDLKAIGKTITFQGLFEKTFVRGDFSIQWIDSAFKTLSAQVGTPAGLAQFEKEHPDLNAPQNKYLGRSCTYFASTDMYDLLKKMPEEERLCDVRLTDDAESLALAIRASAAEPTYFAPVVDPTPSKILLTQNKDGHASATKTRSYWGGFVMPMVAQDIRRLLPQVRVLGSGWTRFSDMSATELEKLVLINSNAVAKATEFWADTALVPKQDYRDKLKSALGLRPSLEEEFKLGEARAKECFALERAGKKPCLTEGVVAPIYDTPVFDSTDFPKDEPLETKRGLGDVLDAEASGAI